MSDTHGSATFIYKSKILLQLGNPLLIKNSGTLLLYETADIMSHLDF